MTKACFHCAEPVPPGCDLTVRHGGCNQPVCCVGCQAVADLIIAGGTGQYYEFRTAPAARANAAALAQLAQWEAFDGQQHEDEHGVATISLLIEGVHCGACSWLIESRLTSLPGVTSIDVDCATSTAVLRFKPATVRLSKVLGTLVKLGFAPHPLEANTTRRVHQSERADLLRRLAVGGLGMMQVMMFAVATYAGALRGIDPAIERLLLGVSMVVAAPVVFYAGAPFLVGAIRALAARGLNMDVPIAIALVLAYGTSCAHFFMGHGATYFESVSMFVFFLLCARLVAMTVRHRSIDANLALASLLPDTALRLVGDAVEHVSRTQLKPGDLVRVRAGDAVPADGVIVEGQSELDEALLSGESTPNARGTGQAVLAGSVNVTQPLVVKVTQADVNSRVARTAARLGATRAARPRRHGLAETLAARFVGALLIVALLVGGVWLVIDPSRALGIVLAVLVVTCPCALSLAMPTALSAAATRLARDGLLINDLSVFETLSQVNVALFDKTGTLSVDSLTIDHACPDASHPHPVSAQALLAMVAAVEAHSAHPIASAFAEVPQRAPASQVRMVVGCGLVGVVDQRRLRIGSAPFVGTTDKTEHQANVFVADQHGVLGHIALRGAWREDAKSLIRQLTQAGIQCQILSGDAPEKVAKAVRELGLYDGVGHCLPEDKLARLRSAQRDGKVVMAVGDGVNDAAFLAGADLSIAVASGADLAQAVADMVLTGTRLQPLAALPQTARRVRRVVRQNLAWAIGYNAVAVPLAAVGAIGPGLAALGMSLSSLVVVLNSARLTRRPSHGEASSTRPADTVATTLVRPVA